MPAISFDSAASADVVAALPHLVRRFDFGGSGGGISPGAIALIVCLGLLPVFVIGGFVWWLLAVYGRDGSCCACCGGRRKRKSDSTPIPRSASDSDTSIFSEKSFAVPPTPKPARTHARHDSALSRQSCGDQYEQQPHNFV